MKEKECGPNTADTCVDESSKERKNGLATAEKRGSWDLINLIKRGSLDLIGERKRGSIEFGLAIS